MTAREAASADVICGECGQARADQMSRVYLIGVAGSTLYPAKIGWSVRPVNRLKDLQRNCGTGHDGSLRTKDGRPVQLAVLWAFLGDRALEARFHRQFAPLREYGEWFGLGSDPVTQMRQALVSFEAFNHRLRRCSVDNRE
jgi:hypothetical protein